MDRSPLENDDNGIGGKLTEAGGTAIPFFCK